MTRSADYYIDFVDAKVVRRTTRHETAYDWADESMTVALQSHSSRILDIQPQEDGSFILVEGCDSYFVVQLTRAAFQRWIHELQELLDQ